jgi:hypothetical protein
MKRPPATTKSTASAWRCPACNRKFARPNQSHSCQVVSLSSHLGKASVEVRAIYDALIAALEELGPYQAVPTKTGINIMVRTSLGGMTIHRTYVNLGLVFTRRIESPRVGMMLQLSPRSFVHRFRVNAASEVDTELRGWMAEAYAVGQMAGRRPS